jgi:hypothetical protein
MTQIIDKYESGTSSRASARVFSAIQSATAPSSRRLQLKPAQAGSPSPPQSPRRRSPAPRPAVSPGRSGPARPPPAPPPAPFSWSVPVPPAAVARCRGGRESGDRACYVDLALHRVLSGLFRQLHGERVQLAEAVPEASRFQDVPRGREGVRDDRLCAGPDVVLLPPRMVSWCVMSAAAHQAASSISTPRLPSSVPVAPSKTATSPPLILRPNSNIRPPCRLPVL